MSRLSVPHHLAVLHLVLCALVVCWNLWTARRTARLHTTPPALAFLIALGALLLLPALTVLLVSDSLIAGRALYSIAWIWPATAVLALVQAAYALKLRFAAPPIGVPIVLYDLVIAAIAIARYLEFIGATPGTPVLAFVAAERAAVAMYAQPLALIEPWYLFLPIFAPATPARRGAGTALRTAVATLAAAWGALIVINLPLAGRAVHSYDRYTRAHLQDRPDSDFVVGLKVFPSLSGPPAPISVTNDLALADTIGAGALTVYVTPDGATAASLDTIAHVLDDVRGGKVIIVALDLSHESRPRAAAAYLEARAADVARIAERLNPDYVVPVVDPLGAAARGIGPRSMSTWTAYLAAAAAAAHAANAHVHVMAHVGGFTAGDSALFAWAASARSPVDAVGLTLFPTLGGAASLDARMRTIDAWCRTTPARPLWVLEAGGLPMAHGDRSQALALAGELAWATGRAALRGLVVYEASDYEAPIGLRAAGGRVRPAAETVRAAIAELGKG